MFEFRRQHRHDLGPRLEFNDEALRHWHRREHLGERRQPLTGKPLVDPAASIELAEFGQRGLGHHPPNARHPLGIAVVDADDPAICSEVEVGLDRVGLLLPRLPKCGQRILRGGMRRAAVGGDELAVAGRGSQGQTDAGHTAQDTPGPLNQSGLALHHDGARICGRWPRSHRGHRGVTVADEHRGEKAWKLNTRSTLRRLSCRTSARHR